MAPPPRACRRGAKGTVHGTAPVRCRGHSAGSNPRGGRGDEARGLVRRHEGTECFIFGRRQSGYFTLRTIDGKLVKAAVSYKKLRFIEESKRILMSINKKRQAAIPPTDESVGFLAV